MNETRTSQTLILFRNFVAPSFLGFETRIGVQILQSWASELGDQSKAKYGREPNLNEYETMAMNAFLYCNWFCVASNVLTQMSLLYLEQSIPIVVRDHGVKRMEFCGLTATCDEMQELGIPRIDSLF